MRIACLAWGSLVWKPGDVRLASDWFDDGPALPVEFCRVDDKGELSTALCADAAPVPVCWALLATHDLVAAREELRRREGIPASDDDLVGSTPHATRRSTHADEIAAWAARHDVDAVVWTALPPRIGGENGRMPTVGEAIAYLRSLEGPTRALAEDYVRRVPVAIATAYRAAIERSLGWTPIAR